MKNKISLINIITSIVLQAAMIISGFIIPRIILSTFGSDVNGLISSIQQFLSYITIVEGGISGVVIANLYKPLLDKDKEKLSRIIKTASTFYRKIGVVFLIYSIGLSMVYPILFKTGFSFNYVCTLTIILSSTLFIQYMFALTYRVLLIADKKIYIVSLVQIIIILINTLVTIIVAKVYPNIHVLKLLSGIIYILQPIIFGKYIEKHYEIHSNETIDNSLIKQRWNAFAINIAAFIHNSTDVCVLTIFTNLKLVSVYSIYALVTAGIKQIITSIASAITPTIGQAYARNDYKELNEKLDVFEYIIYTITFAICSITILLITPFVMIYTKGITDVNYNQELFGILLVIAEGIYLIKLPHLNLAYAANKFKEIEKPAIIEALVNIIISIILVKKYGLIGVAIGTLIAMLYRMAFHIQFTKKIIKRSQWKTYKKLLIYFVTVIIAIAICHIIAPTIDASISSWFMHAIMYTLIHCTLLIIVSFLFYKKEVKYILTYLKSKNVNLDKSNNK